jgi:hypothetical protein
VPLPVEAVEKQDARPPRAAATPKGTVVLADDDWSGISENAFGPAQFKKGGGGVAGLCN